MIESMLRWLSSHGISPLLPFMVCAMIAGGCLVVLCRSIREEWRKTRKMEREEKQMRYRCNKPEWADNEPCPIGTGEFKGCEGCIWAEEEE